VHGLRAGSISRTAAGARLRVRTRHGLASRRQFKDAMRCFYHVVPYHLRDTGTLVELTWGLNKLPEAKGHSSPDLAVVGAKAPNAAICLISALALWHRHPD